MFAILWNYYNIIKLSIGALLQNQFNFILIVIYNHAFLYFIVRHSPNNNKIFIPVGPKKSIVNVF